MERITHRLRVFEVVFWGLHVACPLPWNSGKVIDLVLKVVGLECHGGENGGLLSWGGDVVGYKGRADGPNSLRSGAAFRGILSIGAGGRFGCYRNKLRLTKSRSGGRHSESGGYEQRQRWGYEVREHGFSFGVYFGLVDG